MYGTQTQDFPCPVRAKFENDVEMYGTQTINIIGKGYSKFENDVEMYGTQTDGLRSRKKGLV